MDGHVHRCVYVGCPVTRSERNDGRKYQKLAVVTYIGREDPKRDGNGKISVSESLV